MAGVEIRLDKDLFGKALADVESKLGDLSELMLLLAGRTVKMITRKFQQSGPGWVPLAERTLQRRRKRGKGAKPLLDTGQLRSSITGGTDSILDVTGDGFRVGTNLIKAATHQFGNPDGFRRGINIPARPFLPDQAEWAKELLPLIERYLKDKLS